MALVDRGDSRAVTYLGSCMLTTTATGVGAVQKPLRDLYFTYRQSGGAPNPSRQRYLTMSSRGLTMTWKDPSKKAPTEVFYSMPNILFWDAVQFVVVKGTKKLCGAFEPLDNDHSRNKDNLFVVLDKKYHFLQQMRHPSLFICVLRRTTGVKAMDVHGFVCSNDDEALGLVHGLNAIQDSYNENQVSETGAFSYRPFSTAGDAGVSGAPVSRPVPGLYQPPTVPGQPNIQHLAAQNAAAAAAAARESQAYPRQPVGQLDHKSPESNSSQQNNVISLTQDDFQPISRGSPERGPLRGRKPAFPEPDVSRIEEEGDEWNNEEDVYHYIGHIAEPGSPSGIPPQDYRGFDPPNPRGAPLVTSPYDRNRNRIPSDDYDRGAAARSPPKEYVSITKSVELTQDTFSSTAFRKPSNIIAKFEERAKGSKATAAVRPQSIVPPKVAPKTAPKPVPSPVDRNPSKLGQGYSFLSGSGSPLPGQEDRRYDYDNAPSPYPRSRSPGYDRELPEDSSLTRQHLVPSAFYGNQDDRNTRGGYSNYPIEQSRIYDRSTPIAADAWVPPRQQYNSPPRYYNQPPPEPPLFRQPQSSPFDRPRSFGDRDTPDPPPPRPVAKVTPHKVSGVGVRVLPPNPAVPRSPGERPMGRVSPLGHRQQPNMPEEYLGGQQPSRRPKSQYPDEPKFQAESYGSQERRDNEAKWKQKPNEETKKEAKKGEETDRNMSEKLLLSKKKDAEIASVMQNLRFDYDTSTVTPGVPAGNNFEKSLGYFP